MNFKHYLAANLYAVQFLALLVVPAAIVLTTQTSNGQQPINPALVETIDTEVKQPQGFRPPKRGIPNRREGAGTR